MSKFNYQDKALELCKNQKTIFIYYAVKNELKTQNIIKKLLALNKTVVLPRCSGKNIVCLEIKSLKDLEKGSFSIPEPKKTCRKIKKEKIDIFFVPGTQFDAKGNRKGHGYGYFDRFLKNIDKITVGMCFEKQLKHEIKAKKHDVPVNYVLTEKRFVKAN